MPNLDLYQPLSRRQALGVLAAPFVASCFPDRLTSPRFSLSETGPITLVGAGDPHALLSKAHPSRTTGAMIKAVLDADPNARAFALGDLVNTGTALEYQYYHQSWGSFKDRTLFQIGNHERKADPAARAYYDYAGELAGPKGKGYYAQTLGAWRCYFLNSETLRSQQTAWLAADLPQWSDYHIMAMWHSPMYASVCVHSGKAMQMPGQLGPWWQLLQDHGAEFVVSGHTHRYERYARMLRNGTASNQGVRQFIVGTGGVKPMPVLSTHPRVEEQFIGRGIIRFDLYTDRYEWEFTDLAGVTKDSGAQNCRKVVQIS
jgi:acid phosphatase type 7